MKKYISKGMVEGLTKVIIDELFVEDFDADLPKEEMLTLQEIMLADFQNY